MMMTTMKKMMKIMLLAQVLITTLIKVQLSKLEKFQKDFSFSVRQSKDSMIKPKRLKFLQMLVQALTQLQIQMLKRKCERTITFPFKAKIKDLLTTIIYLFPDQELISQRIW